MCNGLGRCCYLLCCCCCICFRKCCGGSRRKSKKKRSGRVAPSSRSSVVTEERAEVVVESQPESTVCELQPEREPKIVAMPAPKPEPESPPVPKRRVSVPVVRKDHYSSPVVDVNADPCLEDRIVVKGRSSSYIIKRYRSTVYNPNEIANILKKVGDDDRPKVETIMEIPERSRFSRKASKGANVRKGPKQAYDCLLNEPPEDYEPYNRRRDCIDEGESERRDYIPYVKQCLPKNVCEENRSPECEDEVDDECLLNDPCELERRKRSNYDDDACDPGASANRRYEDSRNECNPPRRQRSTTCEDTVCYSRGRNQRYEESRNECNTRRTDVCEDICDPGASRSLRSDEARRTTVCDEDARSRGGPPVERYSKSDEARRTTVCDEDGRSRTPKYSDSRGGPPVERYSKSDDARRTTVCDEDARSRTSRYSDSRGGPSAERYSRSDEARRSTVCDEDSRSKTPRYSDSRPGPSTQRYPTIDEAQRTTVFDEDASSGGQRHSDARGSRRSTAIEDVRQIRHTETKIEYGTLNTEKPSVERRKSTDKISVSFDDTSRASSSATLPERRSMRASIRDSGRGYQRPPLTPYDSQKVFTSGRSISEDQLLSKKSSKSIMDIKEIQEPLYRKRNLEKTMTNDSEGKTFNAKRAPEKTIANAAGVGITPNPKGKIPEESQKISKNAKSDDSDVGTSDLKKKTNDSQKKKSKKTKSDDSVVGKTSDAKKKMPKDSQKKISKRAKSDDSVVGKTTYAKKTVHEVTTIQKTTIVPERTISNDLNIQETSKRVSEKAAPVDSGVGKASNANQDKAMLASDVKKSEYLSSEDTLLDDEECDTALSSKEKTKKSDCPSWPGPSCLKPGEKPKVSYVDRKAMRTPEGDCPRWVTRTEGLGVIRSAKDPCENINYDTKKKDPLVPEATFTTPTDPQTTDE